MYAQHLGPDSESRGSINASLVAGEAWDETEILRHNGERDVLGGVVYARNLDWAQQLRDVQGHDIEQGSRLGGDGAIIGPSSSVERSIGNFQHGGITSQTEFYQPEPTLLDIAIGAHADIVNRETPVSPTTPDTNTHKFGNPDLSRADGPPEISAQEAEFYNERYAQYQ